MNRCAVEVMKDIKDITMAYGQSDEYRYFYRLGKMHQKITGSHPQFRLAQILQFVLTASQVRSNVLKAELYSHTCYCSKISSTVVSLFAANYVMRWKEYFGDDALRYPPCFDSRVVCYPSDQNLRDYLSWRQADCKQVQYDLSAENK